MTPAPQTTTWRGGVMPRGACARPATQADKSRHESRQRSRRTPHEKAQLVQAALDRAVDSGGAERVVAECPLLGVRHRVSVDALDQNEPARRPIRGLQQL